MVRRHTVNEDDLELVEPVTFPMSEIPEGFHKDIKKWIKASDFHLFMGRFNEFLKNYQGTENVNVWRFSPFIQKHFEYEQGDTYHLALALLRRQKDDGSVVKTSNPVIALVAAKERTEMEGEKYAVVDRLMYFEESNPTEEQGGLPYFKIVKMYPMDPDVLTPAKLLKVACDINADEDDKFKKVAELFLMEGFLKFFKKTSPIGGIGHYCTKTVKLFSPFTIHLNGAIAELFGGLVSFYTAKLIAEQHLAPLNEMALLITAEAAIGGKKTSLPKAGRVRVGRKRRNREARDESIAGGDDEDDDDDSREFFELCDGTHGLPEVSKTLDEFCGERSDDEKIQTKDLDKDPVMELIKGLPEDEKKELLKQAEDQLFHQICTIFANFSFNSKHVPTASRDTVVWAPKSIPSLSVDDKDSLMRLFQSIPYAISTHPYNGIFFSRLMYHGGSDMLLSCIERVLDSQDARENIFMVLNQFSDDIKEELIESNDLFALVFGCTHEFISVWMETSTRKLVSELRKKGYKLTNFPVYPAMEKYQAEVCDEDEDDEQESGISDKIRQTLSKIAYRVTHRVQALNMMGMVFLCGAYYNDGKMEVTAKQLKFPSIQRVMEHHVTLDMNTLPMQIAGETSSYYKTARAVREIADHCFAQDPNPINALVKMYSTELVFSVLNNFIKGAGGYIRQLFDFDDETQDLEELLQVLDAPQTIFPEDTFEKGNVKKSLIKLLTKIGDTHYLIHNLPEISISAVRALVLAGLLETSHVITHEEDSAVDQNDPVITFMRIQAFEFIEDKVALNPRFLHLTPKALSKRDFERDHLLSQHRMQKILH